jgi:hypothetical protein
MELQYRSGKFEAFAGGLNQVTGDQIGNNEGIESVEQRRIARELLDTGMVPSPRPWAVVSRADGEGHELKVSHWAMERSYGSGVTGTRIAETSSQKLDARHHHALGVLGLSAVGCRLSTDHEVTWKPNEARGTRSLPTCSGV